LDVLLTLTRTVIMRMSLAKIMDTIHLSRMMIMKNMAASMTVTSATMAQIVILTPVIPARIQIVKTLTLKLIQDGKNLA